MASKTKQQIIDELTEEVNDLEQQLDQQVDQIADLQSKIDHLEDYAEILEGTVDHLRGALDIAARDDEASQALVDELCERVEAAEESLDIVNSNVEYYQVLLEIGAVVLESAIKDLEAAHAENLAVAEVLGDVARVISGSFVDPDAHDYIESGIITEIDALPMLLCQLLDEIAERGCATEPDPEPADGSTDTPTITIDGTVSVSPLSLLELITDFFGSQSHPLYYDRHA